MRKGCHLQLKDKFLMYYKTNFSFWLNEQTQEYLFDCGTAFSYRSIVTHGQVRRLKFALARAVPKGNESIQKLCQWEDERYQELSQWKDERHQGLSQWGGNARKKFINPTQQPCWNQVQEVLLAGGDHDHWLLVHQFKKPTDSKEEKDWACRLICIKNEKMF